MADPNYEYAAYGTFAWMYNSDGAVHDLIDQASREKWPPEKLAEAIKGTGWWRSMVASEREWNQYIADDPRSALEKRNRKAEEIERMASTMGITLQPGVADSFADSFYRFGWNELQLNNSLLSQFEYERGKTTGAAATIEMQLRGVARDYTVPLSDNTMKSWIISIEQGRNTIDTFKTQMAQIAAADNPWMASALDAGFSVRDILDPYVEAAARELGISSAEIDLSEPKWRKLLEQTDAKGERVRPNTQQVIQLVRNDDTYGWDKTTGAVDTAAKFATELAGKFGAV